MFRCCAGPAPLEPGRRAGTPVAAPHGHHSPRHGTGNPAPAPASALSHRHHDYVPDLGPLPAPVSPRVTDGEPDHATASPAAGAPMTWRQQVGAASSTGLALSVLSTLQESLRGNPEAAMAIHSLRDDLMREVAVQRRELHARRESVASEGSTDGSGVGTHPAPRTRRRSRGADLVRRMSIRHKPGMWDIVARVVGIRTAERRKSIVDRTRGVHGSEFFVTATMDDATRAWVNSELESRQPHFDRQEPRINDIADVVGAVGDDMNIVEPISLMDDEVVPYDPSAAPAPASAALPLPADPAAGDEPVRVIERARSEAVLAAESVMPTGPPIRDASDASGSVASVVGGRPPLGPGSSVRAGGAASAVGFPAARDDRPIGQLPAEAYLPVSIRPEGSLRSMVHLASLSRVPSFQSIRGESVGAQGASVGISGIGVSASQPGGSMGASASAGSDRVVQQHGSAAHLALPPPAYPSPLPVNGGSSSFTAAVPSAVAPPAAGGVSTGLTEQAAFVRRRSFTFSAADSAPPVPSPSPVAATPASGSSSLLQRSSMARISSSVRNLLLPRSAAAAAVPAAGRVEGGLRIDAAAPVQAHPAAAIALASAGDGGARHSALTPKNSAAAASIYYVNPNAIGAADDKGVADEVDYVRSRITVVQRIRDLASIFTAPDPSHRRPSHLQHAIAAAPKVKAAAPGAAGRGRGLTKPHGGSATGSSLGLGRKPSQVVPPPDASVAGRTLSQAVAVQERDRAVAERLRLVTRWDFDVFEFGANTDQRPLAYISYELFVRFSLFERLRVPENVFTAFLNRMETEYCHDPTKPNPYHTSLHAADVVQAVGHFLTVPRLGYIMDQLDAFVVLVAAIIHDYRHPGVNNNFLVKTSHALALRYNDESVLENFHAAEAFAVLSQDRYNILQSLSTSQRSTARFAIVKTVLATDLAQGAKFLNAFKAKSHQLNMGDNDEDKLLVMQLMIKCADVSHPARALHVHERWSNLISDEFYLQGDRERELGMAISPLCDRTSHNLAKSQTGFIDFVVRPSFSAFSAFCDTEQWMDLLKSNLKHWKEMASAATAALLSTHASSAALPIAASTAASRATAVVAPAPRTTSSHGGQPVAAASAVPEGTTSPASVPPSVTPEKPDASAALLAARANAVSVLPTHLVVAAAADGASRPSDSSPPVKSMAAPDRAIQTGPANIEGFGGESATLPPATLACVPQREVIVAARKSRSGSPCSGDTVLTKGVASGEWQRRRSVVGSPPASLFTPSGRLVDAASFVGGLPGAVPSSRNLLALQESSGALSVPVS